jgi:diaminopimelate epimerase
VLTLASASGNAFAYAWEDEVPPTFDGPTWAQRLCPRDGGLGLDGLFLLHRPKDLQPWVMEHWDTDGSYSFCSNGSRAAAALPGAPFGGSMEVLSSGEQILLSRCGQDIGLRMPEGAGFGLRPPPFALPQPGAYGWIGNPQLILAVPSVAAVNLAEFAPPLRHHQACPEGLNVNILEITSPGEAKIRSWERGVEGETLCCGTGSAVAGAWLTQRTGIPRWRIQPSGRDPVTVHLELQPDGTWRNLWLSGPVRILGYFHPLTGFFST